MDYGLPCILTGSNGFKLKCLDDGRYLMEWSGVDYCDVFIRLSF